MEFATWELDTGKFWESITFCNLDAYSCGCCDCSEPLTVEFLAFFVDFAFGFAILSGFDCGVFGLLADELLLEVKYRAG